LGIWHTHYEAIFGVGIDLEAVENEYGIAFAKGRVIRKV